MEREIQESDYRMNGKAVALGIAAIYPVAVLGAASYCCFQDRWNYNSRRSLLSYVPDGVEFVNREITYLLRRNN